MTTKRLLTAGFAATLILSSAGSLRAGEIISATPFPGINSIAGVFIAPPPAPNNDNVGLVNPNQIAVLQKDYTVPTAVDILFEVVPSGGVTEYAVTEEVFNSTGTAFSEYRVLLGFGTGGGFVQSGPGDGLDFDFPDFDSPIDFSAFYTTITPGEDEIVATGGLFPNFALTVPDFQFSIDVPDGISSFTLRQQPTAVPEPASLALLAFGSIAVLSRRRRTGAGRRN